MLFFIGEIVKQKLWITVMKTNRDQQRTKLEKAAKLAGDPPQVTILM